MDWPEKLINAVDNFYGKTQATSSSELFYEFSALLRCPSCKIDWLRAGICVFQFLVPTGSVRFGSVWQLASIDW